MPPLGIRSATDADVAIVGAGAAGLAAAIFTRRLNPELRVVLMDGARAPGAKILVSGGSRCNVTNAVVSEQDFNGGRPAFVRRVLRGFTVTETVAFFEEVGVSLREEPGGKLFPVTNRSRDVLRALLDEAERTGVRLLPEHRVLDVSHDDEADPAAATSSRFRVVTSQQPWSARMVVLATGGLSLPKTGSDGAGYGFAKRLGHTIVTTTPALVPLVLDRRADGRGPGPSGVTHLASLDVRVRGALAARVHGSLLWTHFGISGPAALDASRHWLRSRLDDADVVLTANLCPDFTFETLEARWLMLGRSRTRASVQSALAGLVPASVGAMVLAAARIDERQPLAELTRESRRRLTHALSNWPLPVRDSRGYNYAEVTAGGVSQAEVQAATMESRVCPGLYLVGEILDVDGRLGGFNFQWAWSSARVASLAITARFR